MAVSAFCTLDNSLKRWDRNPAGGKLVINPLRVFIEESFSARLS
ncbi:hypothetical protein [Geovibrio thiophilus]|nr:hypothetical protein [Geovibrio thiophilus]